MNKKPISRPCPYPELPMGTKDFSGYTFDECIQRLRELYRLGLITYEKDSEFPFFKGINDSAALEFSLLIGRVGELEIEVNYSMIIKWLTSTYHVTNQTN